MDLRGRETASGGDGEGESDADGRGVVGLVLERVCMT